MTNATPEVLPSESSADGLPPEAVRLAADRLRTAAAEGRPTTPVRDLIGVDDTAAYAVQQQHAQSGVFLTYTAPSGRTFLDRELYLPKAWTDDRDRCESAGIPADRDFATKPALPESECIDPILKPAGVDQ